MESQIKDWMNSFLTLMDNKYYQYVSDEGQVFKPLEDSSEAIEPYKSLMPSILQKSCFRNALLASLVIPELEYHQGYYVTDLVGIPFEHAWNVHKGELIDLTAEKFGIKVVEYFGVQIPNDFLERYSDTEQHLTALQAYLFEINQK